MVLNIFTIFHVAISLIGLLAGYVAVIGLVRGTLLHGWTGTFLGMTLATSVTGFFFPRHHFMPAHAVGIVSLVGLRGGRDRRQQPSPSGLPAECTSTQESVKVDADWSWRTRT